MCGHSLYPWQKIVNRSFKGLPYPKKDRSGLVNSGTTSPTSKVHREGKKSETPATLVVKRTTLLSDPDENHILKHVWYDIKLFFILQVLLEFTYLSLVSIHADTLGFISSF